LTAAARTIKTTIDGEDCTGESRGAELLLGKLAMYYVDTGEMFSIFFVLFSYDQSW
jgi:cytidylate kinase